MSKPKKLIRHKIIDKLKPGEWEEITDQDELNKLYELKILEELDEIKSSDHKDINEFADLVHAVYAFARVNGFAFDKINEAAYNKSAKNGSLVDIALNNLNPENPSNKIYFDNNK